MILAIINKQNQKSMIFYQAEVLKNSNCEHKNELFINQRQIGQTWTA